MFRNYCYENNPVVSYDKHYLGFMKYKIQIFNYNSKYIVKIELGDFEQTYKIRETNIDGLDDVENMITQHLLSASLSRFVEMRSDWENAFKEKNTQV